MAIGRHAVNRGEIQVLGHYRCSACGHEWRSAQSYAKRNEQDKLEGTSRLACKRHPKTFMTPYLCENLEEGRDGNEMGGPHLSHLCERCINGETCRAAQSQNSARGNWYAGHRGRYANDADDDDTCCCTIM